MIGPWRIGIGVLAGIAAAALAVTWLPARQTLPPATVPRTTIGLNLSGLANYNREQVFANLIAQSEWFSDSGAGWSAMPADQLDDRGWVRFLKPGQVAPRPFVLPAAPFRTVAVRCTYAGKGALSAGGIARIRATAPGSVDLDLVPENGVGDSGWIQLDRTDPADPLRQIDCRDTALPPDALFAPAFVRSLKGFSAVRFLDWQLTNLNRAIPWQGRTRSDSATQLAGDGASIEAMVRLANEARVDPWFLMPYPADAAYIEGFARLVHDRLAADRTVHVELGNEVWNDMFAATLQARREGIAAGLAPADDPNRAQMLRYAQKARDTMRIWTRVFRDRPTRLVRVVSTLNVYPDLAAMLFAYQDMPRWIDALATAPYIHLDLADRGPADVDWAFARLDAAIAETIDHAARNKAIAARYGKRYIAYEGGQHLVPRNLELARALQRDPRMADVYRRYLTAWQSRIGDRLMLYASTSPIGESGAWGLREYAGQPEAETPKLRAVRPFLTTAR